MAKGSQEVKLQKPRLALSEWLAKIALRRLSPRGRELPSDRPMQPPVGYKREPSMVEIVRQQIRSEQMAQAARMAGHETFEEADDFDVEDDPMPVSQYDYEEEFEPPVAEPAVAPGAEKDPPSDGPKRKSTKKSSDAEPASDQSPKGEDGEAG